LGPKGYVVVVVVPSGCGLSGITEMDVFLTELNPTWRELSEELKKIWIYGNSLEPNIWLFLQLPFQVSCPLVRGVCDIIKYEVVV
jgi:hypothetical protein